MTAVPLGASYDNRGPARSPLVLVKNLVVEEALTNQAPTSFAGGISDPYQIDHKAWITRPGVKTFGAPSTAPFRGCYQQDGLFGLNGTIYVVNGFALYSTAPDAGNFNLIGGIPGGDPVMFAASTENMLICGGGKVFSYDGTNFLPVVMPNGESVSWVTYLAGYFLLGVQSSRTIFFLIEGGTVPDALDYFSAETNPGNVICGSTLLDQLILFKSNVTEFWQPSGDADLPFNRIVGQVYQRGVQGRFSLAQVDNSIYFVGNDGSVYDCSSVPERISTNAVEEQIRLNIAGQILCWSFSMDGHSYFLMTLTSGTTLVYDVLSQSWLSWTDATGALGYPAQMGVAASGGVVYGGNPVSADLYSISAAFTDDDGAPIEREVMGGLSIIGPPQRCDNFQIVVDSGGGSDPLNQMEIDLRWSDDQGQTYSAWLPMYAGAAGAYSVQPVAKMLGLMRPPARIFHIRCSTPGPFRISYARVNEYFATSWPSAPSILPAPNLALNEDGSAIENEDGVGNVLLETQP